MVEPEYLIGIDGGGSGTRAVVQRAGGAVIATGKAGPSALGQGVAQAWRNIEAAVRDAFTAGGLAVPAWSRCALGAGLSGVGHAPWREAWLQADPGFGFVRADQDSFTLLLGAHAGKPGAIVIAGTGSVAEALRADGSRVTVGGWGFPSGDEGSGSWLGLGAMRHAQAAFDGRATIGALARRVWMACGDERESLQAWCARSAQFAYAQLARLVFECEAADPAAARLLQDAVSALEELALAVDPRGRLPLVLGGSIGERLAPRLKPAVRCRVVAPQQDAAHGALLLVRRALQEEQEETA